MEGIRLTLYVLGPGARSANAIERVRRLSEETLAGRAQWRVVDLLADPQAGQREGVIVAPTLVKETPAPELRTFGDLSDPHEVLWALGIPAG